MDPTPTSHSEVFQVLCKRGYELNRPGRLLKLYPQPIQEAVLYRPGVGATHPLHVHHERSEARSNFFESITRYVARAQTRRDSRGWDHYDVVDWPGFYSAVVAYNGGGYSPDLELTAEVPQVRIAVARMAAMARATAAASNGQEVLRTVKNKDLRFEAGSALEAHIATLLEEQEGRCAVSGIELSYDDTDPDLRCSLDRIDSSGHYEPGNLQVVCWFVNRWKSDDTDNNFRRLLKLVRDAHQGPAE